VVLEPAAIKESILYNTITYHVYYSEAFIIVQLISQSCEVPNTFRNCEPLSALPVRMAFRSTGGARFIYLPFIHHINNRAIVHPARMNNHRSIQACRFVHRHHNSNSSNNARNQNLPPPPNTSNPEFATPSNPLPEPLSIRTRSHSHNTSRNLRA
jgi:hypothetical protein